MFAIIENGVPIEYKDRDYLLVPANGEFPERKIPYHTLKKFSEAERNAVGIYTVQEPIIPEGKRSTGFTLSFANNVVTKVYTLEDIPAKGPSDYPLLRWQFIAMVNHLGVADSITQAINSIQDPLEREIVRARYLHTEKYNRNDPLFNQLGTAIGFTAADIDAAWMTIVSASE